MTRIRLATAVVVAIFLIGVIPIDGSAAEDDAVPNKLNYQGKPLGYWLNIVRERDPELIFLAFDAIRSFGPAARSAVPDLTRFVAAPFEPVQIGQDSDEVIADKLFDIELRSSAIDALGSIGEDAAPSTPALIQWALTLRVVCEDALTNEEFERFIDLMALDVEYRLRVIAIVTEFGKPALPTLLRLLKSRDTETRKIAVAILGLDALTIASELMKTHNCEDGQLAITILKDMEPVVAKAYIAALRQTLVCDAVLAY